MSAQATEAQAIYISLKHVTNVLGYKILDLNHPTLSRMICDKNRCNGQINLLEACAIWSNPSGRVEEVRRSISDTYFQLSNSKEDETLTTRFICVLR